MSVSVEIAELFARDLSRLVQELNSFPDDASLWMTLEGVSNSAGNLTLHLEGNLREYIGRQLGQIPYVRERELEFKSTGVSKSDLISRIEEVSVQVPRVVSQLPESVLTAVFPQQVLNRPVTTQQFLFHLYGHFSYHLGQIDYLRRILTKGASITFATL